MLDFENFVARHGEYGAQAIVENIERYEGIPSRREASLEERWELVVEGSTQADLYKEA